jgi:hypothetical protein
MQNYPYLRRVHSPVTSEQLRPLDPKCLTVQFDEPLTESEHKKVAKFLRAYPRVQLRAYGHHSTKPNLDFLPYYSDLRHLAIELFELKDLSGLQHAPAELKSLTLGQTRSKSHSLSFLQRFPSLRSLYLEGHSKSIDVVGSLSKLEVLTLRSITLPDLSILLPLNKLHSLGIKLGGTTNLSLLPKIGKLRYLELWMVRGLSDLSCVADIRTLQYLFLQALKQVKKLPSLSRLRLLRRVHLETMKGLEDLQAVADAPALQELLAIDMGQLEPEAFQPFVKHRTLRRATVGNGMVANMLGLPEVENDFKFQA